MKLFVDFWKFTKIWKDLWHRNTELILFWLLDVQNNSMFPTMQEHSKTGKKSEIKRQTFVIWWLNSRRYRCFWYLFSFKQLPFFETSNVAPVVIIRFSDSFFDWLNQFVSKSKLHCMYKCKASQKYLRFAFLPVLKKELCMYPVPLCGYVV